MNIGSLIRVVCLTVSMAGTAFAANVVLYDLANNQNSGSGLNTISYSKSGVNSGKLVAENISISTLSRQSPGPVSLRNCIGCTLNFISGSLMTYTNAGLDSFGYPITPSWAFNSGGSASITGGVDLNGNGILDGGDIAAGSTLLTGFFLNSPTVTSYLGSDFRVAAGLILNSQNTQLNQFFFGQPLSGPVWTGTLNLEFNPIGPAPPGGTRASPTFSSKLIIDGSLVNSAAVPEPGSVLLFSSITGFLGLGLAMRRRRANQIKG